MDENQLGNRGAEPSQPDVKPGVASTEEATAGSSQENPVTTQEPMEFQAGPVGQDPVTDLPGTTAEENALDVVMAEKTNLERVNFNLSLELSDAKERIIALSTAKNELVEQNKIHMKELSERSRLFTQLEASRNDIATKNMNLETETNRLKQEKEERDASIKALNRDKQLFITENLQLKEELKGCSGEKSKLELQLATLEQDSRSLSVEKEWRRTDKQFYEESKKWFLEELGKKDAKVTQLNLEMAAKATQWQNERLELSRELAALQAKIVDFEDQLKTRQESLDRVTANIERQTETHLNEMRNLDLTVKTKNDLAKLYKEQLDKAEHCAEQLEGQLKAREELIQQTKLVLEEVRKEEEDQRNGFLDQIAQKDADLLVMREELEKANELLKNKHAVSLNVTEEELASMCPAAAETTRFLKGGTSLTALVREQNILAGELASEKAKNAELEKTIREIVQDIEENAPLLLSQKEQVEKLFDENSRLKNQLQAADVNRAQVESNRDQAMRELAFTRAELEKFQRDYNMLLKKHHHTLFVLEKTQARERDTDSPPMTRDDEAQLYDSIGQLQKRNMQLESELATERASASQALIATHDKEIEVLRQELNSAHNNEEQLSLQLEQLNAAFSKMQEQSNKLRELVEDDATATQAREAKLKAQEYLAELNSTKLTIARLEGSISTVKEEKMAVEQTYEVRVGNLQTLVSELQMTKSKLEAKFEQQKQVAATNFTELESALREKERVDKENNELRKADSENARKLSEMHSEVLKMHEGSSENKIRFTVASEELERAKSQVAGLNAQLEIYKNQRVSDQHVLGSLNDLSARLSRVQAERDSRFTAQLEVVSVERDALKRDASRINELLAQTREELKNTKARLESEMALLKMRIKEKDEAIEVSDTALMELRNRLSMLQSELVSDGSTEEMSPERLRKECQQLKNRVQFLESQCEERNVQLEAVKAEISRRDTEAQKMEAHSGKMEKGLKDIQSMAALERELLEARAQTAEKRCEELVDQIDVLRNEVDAKEAEFNALKLSSVQVQGDLQIKLDVKEQQMLDHQNRISILNERLFAMESENNTSRTALEKLRTEHAETNDKFEHMRLQVDVLSTKLRSKENACVLAEDNARLAEESRQLAVQALETRNEQAAEAETKWAQAVKEQDERLMSLMAKYDEVITQLGSSQDAAAMESVPLSDVINPELPQAVIQSMQTVIDFLRKEKEECSLRMMKAEVEAKRLQNEVREAQMARNELVNKVRSLESASALAQQMTIEKAELLKKLEEMTVTQQQYQRLLGDVETFRKLAHDAQNQVRERDESLTGLKLVMAEAGVNVRTIKAELDKKTNEVETLKNTLQQQQARLQQRVAEAKTEQSGAQLTQKQTELVQAQKKIALLEKTMAEQKSKIEQTRQLAVKFRSERQKALADADSIWKTEHDKLKQDVTAQIEALKQEKTDLETRIADKTNELEETNIRMKLLSAKVEKFAAINKELEQDITVKKAKIQSLEDQGQQPHDLPSSADLSVSAAVSAAIPPSIPSLVNEAPSGEPPAGVEAMEDDNEVLKSTDVVSPPDAGLSVDVDTAEASLSYVPTTSAASPKAKRFGRGGVNVFSASSSSTTVPTSFAATEPIHAQSDFVSGSLASVDDVSEENPNDSNGESRDSTAAPVSSTEGTRKRPANAAVSSEAKRQRESSSEAVTSSEERVQKRPMEIAADDGGFIPDPVHVEENEDDDDEEEDIIPLDPPNHGGEFFGEMEEDNNAAYDEDDGDDEEEDEDEEEVFDVPDSDDDDEDDDEEGASEMDEDSEDNTGDEEGDGVQPPAYGENEILDDSDTDNQGDDEVRNVDAGQDEEVMGADDNSRSQPILDDQDREAASAVEEADDEGRVSADGGIPDEGAQPAPSGPRIRVPIKFDREDQCSSSNESGSAPAMPRQTARRGAGRRGGRPGANVQIYTPGRGLRQTGRRGSKK